MVVLSPAGTKLTQQNGRYHWEFGMRQRDALERGGRGGCCAYRAEHLTACLYTLTVCTPALGRLYIACTQQGISSSHMHTHTRMWDSQPYTLHFLMLPSVLYACTRPPKHARTWLLHCHIVYAHMALRRYFLCLCCTHNTADSAGMH